MIIDSDGAAYVAAVVQALRAGTLPPDELTSMCPDCAARPTSHRNHDHLVVRVEDGSCHGRAAVVLGCSGNWAINPAKLGIDRPDWLDWRRLLTWTDAGDSDAGYQHAESRWAPRFPVPVTRTFFRVRRETSDETWSVELMMVFDGKPHNGVTWPRYDSEADAKAAAGRFERDVRRDEDQDR